MIIHTMGHQHSKAIPRNTGKSKFPISSNRLLYKMGRGRAINNNSRTQYNQNLLGEIYMSIWDTTYTHLG